MKLKNQPPGHWVIRKSSTSKTAKKFFESIHLYQISCDYFLEYEEATTIEEKQRIIKEYRKEAALSFLLPLGVSTGEAAVIHYFLLEHASMFVSSLGLLIAAVWYMGKK